MSNSALPHYFLDFSNNEFQGWDRFCHVVYPSGTPEDLRFCVVKGSK